jgi:exopolysaccharide biosynthesis predicted pyruvyltransferase EpsI
VIIVNGSGSFAVELWSPGLDGLRHYAQAFRDKPLVVLPSSYYWLATDFPGCFDGRRSPAYLFARERYSYELIRAQRYASAVHVGLDDDMAFALQDSDLLAQLKRAARCRHVLIVERFDAEAVTGLERQLHASPRTVAVVPGALRRALKRVVHRQRTHSSGFTGQVMERLCDAHPHYRKLPVVSEDISSQVGFTFEQFTHAVAEAAVVVTTRLHVAILAAMLDKHTCIVAGQGRYRKLVGCYEHSLARFKNVELWPWPS